MDFSHNDLLRELVVRARAGERVGLVTDVDGTISPIAPTPDAAQVTPRSRDLLRRLAGQIALVAAVSGRAADDLSARVGIPEMVYVGNHGLERMSGGIAEALPEAVAARPALERVIAALQPRLLPGMILEDKRVTLSLHYRQAADPAAVEAAFAPLIAQLCRDAGLRCFSGKLIFEVRPAVEVDKGTAFARLIADHALAAAVFLGDDVTDADALLKASQLRRAGTCYALGIGVESDDTPAVLQERADLLVSGVSGVEAFLDWFSSALSASRT
ncbi:MAG: trehalose-phosphatase [Anaerolineae bacterium]|nr:trehalose-phosphatase [Anaerolineae bacterium]